MKRTVVIAAMEREVRPLVRGWQRAALSDGDSNFVAFENGDRAVVISGIGSKHAERAARAAVARYQPATLISVGLAGALIRSLKAGSVFTPNVVVDAADGMEYRCASQGAGVIGGGVLVTAGEIAGADAKAGLVNEFHALIVDMEAAGVAKAAQEMQVSFRCVKAISDEADFVMPPMAKFVDSGGNFQSGRFTAWAALRPWHWAKVAALASNTGKATRALCEWLEGNLSGNVQPAEVVTLKRTKLPDVVPERR
jgi:adenosylhomocysteine nucleosidase